jgi:hypothetical protein
MKRSYLIIVSLIMILSPFRENIAQLDYGFDFSKSGTAGLQFLK